MLPFTQRHAGRAILIPGMCIGIARGQLVLTRSEGKINIGSDEEWESVTLTGTVSAAGDVTEPHIVLRGC